ncbi:MAG: tRNA (N6-isopentenyl adenosine(37)-C2)-methylthiotransferase MiaB [Acidimicrobiaceae bacterium]|nr:tRNA (N6-isopentenyl adenosine(37)-C2)-methylthiotransferase MiaB [Acidimicrobiaceae bacterium]
MERRKYAVRTFGCQMNEHDSERISGLLEADGLIPAVSEEEADVIVLNTCCIRENADNRLYGALGNLKTLKSERPNVQIAVGGCLAQKDRELIQQRAKHVDVVFGTHNVQNAVKLLKKSETQGPIIEILEKLVEEDNEAFPSALPVRREIDHRAWITIQIGCDNTCTYCIVPSVRGPEISRPFGQLLDEARNFADQGVTEITLLGQNVNSYGRDLTKKLKAENPSKTDVFQVGSLWLEASSRKIKPLFADLLKTVGSIEGIERVRFISPHPKDLTLEIVAAMSQTENVCEHLHLPLQSGSDSILSAMHRGYTSERFLKKMQQARGGIEDLSVTTDLIVGFPGESEKDFENTLAVVAEAQFDAAYTYIFSPRPGTNAAEMESKFVDHSVAVRRYETLRNVVTRSSLLKHKERVGRIEEVLVEGRSKKGTDLIKTRTRQNKILHLKSQDSLRVGTYALVEVTDAPSHYLLGELLEIVATPKHRKRIPVMAEQSV